MTHTRNLLGVTLISFVVSIVSHSILPIVEIAENWLADLRVATLSPQLPQSDDIVIVNITETTLRKFPYRTPIDRGFLSELVADLKAKNAAAIGIDLLFDQPTEATKDQALFRNIETLGVPVVIATADIEDGLFPEQVDYMHQSLANIESGLAVVLENTYDGVVRHILIRRNDQNGERLGFVAQLAQNVGLGLPAESFMALQFRQGPNPDTPFFRSFEAQDIPLLPPAWFESKIVLIGVDLPLEDRHVTPLTRISGSIRTMPGILIHAHALSQLIDGTSVSTMSVPAVWLLVLTFCAISAVIFGAGMPIVIRIFTALALLVLYWWIAHYAYAKYEWMLPLVLPTFAFMFCAGTQSIIGWHSDRRQKRFIRSAFSKFLSPDVITELIENPGKLRLTGEKKELSFLFSDIAGFTGLTERTEPDVLVDTLNRYLSVTCAVVLNYGGTIDKIVGDALHVIFNAPIDQPDHAQRAVNCAMELDRVCEQFRLQQVESGIDFGVTRIGVNTGTAIIGNFGGEDRFDYTAHGDAINTAARLESVNKHIGTRICISETTVDSCPDLDFVPVGKLVLKGKTKILEVFEPARDGEIDTKAYRDAYDSLETGDALAKFEEMHRRFPENPLIRFHYERLCSGESGSIMVMQSK